MGVPGGGERMRNLTTTGLGEKRWNNGKRLRVLSEWTNALSNVFVWLVTSCAHCVVVSVLCTCVKNGASTDLCLCVWTQVYRHLSILATNVNLRMVFFAFFCSELEKVPGRALFRQRSERATACTIRMQIDKKINELNKAKQQISHKEDELQIKRRAVT